MVSRHETIGIKQVIRLAWMQKTANLILAGFDPASARKELHLWLTQDRGDTEGAAQSERTRKFVVSNLMRTWVTPDSELVPFRDACVRLIQDTPSTSFVVHWAIISAAYPFWWHAAIQTGRLLALQDRVTQRQIINRLKEQYGDRATIGRYAQYVIRSFVNWGVLLDTEVRGSYSKSPTSIVSDNTATAILMESALHASVEARAEWGVLTNSPAFFPFQLADLTGTTLSMDNDRIEVVRYGLDTEMVQLVRKGNGRVDSK
jgi:hypothetical protein